MLAIAEEIAQTLENHHIGAGPTCHPVLAISKSQIHPLRSPPKAMGWSAPFGPRRPVMRSSNNTDGKGLPVDGETTEKVRDD